MLPNRKRFNIDHYENKEAGENNPVISDLVKPRNLGLNGNLPNDDYTLQRALEEIKPAEMLESKDMYDKVEWHGDPMCPCGSGLKADECCRKDLRSDWHPLSSIKQYRSKLQNNESDGYVSVNRVDFVKEKNTKDFEDNEKKLCMACGLEKRDCVCAKVKKGRKRKSKN